VGKKDNLTRKGLMLDSNLCVMCSKLEETRSHLFLTCKNCQSNFELMLYMGWGDHSLTQLLFFLSAIKDIYTQELLQR